MAVRGDASRGNLDDGVGAAVVRSISVEVADFWSWLAAFVSLRQPLRCCCKPEHGGHSGLLPGVWCRLVYHTTLTKLCSCCRRLCKSPGFGSSYAPAIVHSSESPPPRPAHRGFSDKS